MSVYNKHCSVYPTKAIPFNTPSFGPLTKHDVVDRVSMHVLLVELGGKQFNVASTTVDALLVFHGELYD